MRMTRLIGALAFLCGVIVAAQAVHAFVGPVGGRHVVAHHEDGRGALHHGGACPGEQNGAFHACGIAMLALNADPARFEIVRSASAGYPRLTIWRAQFVECDPPVPRIAA